jgi:hypothetical protein
MQSCRSANTWAPAGSSKLGHRLAEGRQLLRRQRAQRRIERQQGWRRLPDWRARHQSAVSSAVTGAWSEGRSSLRNSRLIPAAVQRSASASESRMWSIRRPRFFWKPSMR